MAKSPFNIQDQYLNQARKERVHVTILMMSGDKLQGYVKSFDSFCVLVSIGRPIPHSALAPQYPTREATRLPADEPTLADTPGQWEPGRLPEGFVLTARVVRRLPGADLPVEHLVYSDGLAVVSVFIEPVTDSSGPAAIAGLSRMGAVHAFGKVIDGHRVTVIGETPAATVAMIGESMARRP